MTKQALLYEHAVPVNSQKHRDLSVKIGNDYSFAREINAVPLITVEFPRAAEEYAIVFGGKDDNIMPLIILGAHGHENLYVPDTGEWKAGYVPAFIKRYPFVFAVSPDGTNFTLCIDEGFDGCNTEGRGEHLFDAEGEHTQYLRGIIRFLREYEVHFRRTQAFCSKLKELDLLEPMQAQFTAPGGAKGALTGFLAVNRAKLKAISEEKLAEMMKMDELELVYLHLFSLRNFRTMLERSTGQSTQTSETTQSPSAEEHAPQEAEQEEEKAEDDKSAVH